MLSPRGVHQHAGCSKFAHRLVHSVCLPCSTESHAQLQMSCFAMAVGLQTAAGRDLIAESTCEISLRSTGAFAGAAARRRTHAAATLLLADDV